MGFLKGFLRKAEEEIADILPGGKTGKSIRAQRKAPVAKTVSRPRDESKSWLSKDFNPVSDGINDIKSAFKYASKDWKSSENQRQVDTQNANRQILKKYTQGQLNKNQVESLVGSKVKNAGLKKKGNLYVNTVKNSTGETLLQNTGAGIMNAAPQRVIGGLAEYGGTALGNDSIRDFGTRLNQPFRDYNALAYENADNKAVAIGGNIAGNLLTLPIAPAGKAGLAYRGVVAGAPTAADTGYAIKQAGGGRVAQTIGGGATGIASGYLNSVGGDKILKPVGAVTSKLVGKTVTTKLAPTAFGRIGAGVLNEGGEEVIEQGVDNAVAKSTYDPDRKLTENLATSFLLGGAMGGVVRGGVELGNPNTRTQLINESKVKDIANDQGGFVSGRNAKDFKQAEAEARKYKSADEFVEAQSNKFYGDNGDQKFLSGLIGKYKNRGKQGESLTKHFTNDELARYNQIISSENNLNSKQLTDLYNQATQSQPPKPTAVQPDPLESLKQEARPPANAFQDTLPSKSRPASIRELVKRGGNPLYHDTNASGVLGILDSGEIRASQAPFSQIAGQGKRVSTTRNFDNYSRYGKSPYRFVIDETKTGQKAIPDNREEFESIFKNNVKTDSVETLAIDITNPEIINDMNNGRLAEVIAKAKEKGIRVETFEGKILPDEYANKEIQQLTKDRFTKEFGKATQPPKSTAKTVEAKPPTPFEKDLQTAGLAPQPTKGATPERANGLPELQSTQAAQRLLKKQGIDWKKPKSDPLESLKQEARKYKSAEEFVRAINSGQTGVKPATPLEAPRMSRLDDLRPTESGSKYSVKDFDQKKAPPLKVDSQGGIRDGHNRWYAAKESYAKDMKWLDNNWNQKNVDKMNKKWGDINFPQIETQRIYASEFDDNVQQLTDLYNQATAPQVGKTDPLEALKAEARKYKSAEEFVNSYGEPVYHGSRSSDITEFNLDNLNATYMKDGLGINFTNDRSFAELYRRPKNQWGELASKDDGGGKVYKRYIKATNPLDLTASNRKVSDIVSLEQFKKIAKDGSEIKGEGRKYLERIGRSELTTATNDSRVVAKRVSEMTDDQLLEILYGTIKNKNAVGLDAGLESIFRESMFNYKLTESGKKELVESFRKHTGFDAFKTPKENGNYVITTIDPSNIKTKQQLTDLYNQAQKESQPKAKSVETPLQKSNRLHEEKLRKHNLTQNEYAALHDKVRDLDQRANELHRKVGDATQKAIEEANGKPFPPKVRKELKAMVDEWGKALDDHVEAINQIRKIDGQKPIPRATQSQPPKAPVEGKASNQGVSDRRKPVQDKVNRTEPKRTETAPKPTLQDALDGKSTKIEPKVVKTEPKIPKVAPKRTETAPKKPFIPDEIKAIRAKREANTSQQTRTDQTRKNQQALDSKSSVQSQPESKVAPRTGVQSISQAVQGRVNKISPQKARQGIGSKGRQGLLSGLSSKDTIQLSGVNVNDPFNNRKIGKRLKNEFGRYFVDEDAEMINLMKRIEKETGQKDLVETWLQDSDLVRNTNSIANSKIRRNENLKLALRGLSKKQQASFDEYASARTELSNLERGLESSSKPKEQLQQIVRDGNIDFGNRFIALNNYYGDWAKDLHDAGIISKSKLDDWSQNKDYVRVQRDMEDILNYTPPTGKSRSFGTTSTSKKRTGSTREILSPTNIALERGQQLQLEIQRNKAASNTIDTLEKYGLAEKVSQQYATGKNVVKRFKDGKVEYFATSKDVKRVIENVNPFQLGVLGRVISTPTRLFRSGTTALSAPFATTNYVRDQISSAIYSDQALPRLSKTAQGNVEYIAGTHSPKNIVSGIASATKDYFGGSSNPLWEKFEQVAGDQTQFDEMRNTRSSKATMRELRQGGKGALINKIVNPVRSMEDLIGITEKATRFQNFKGIYEAEMKRSGNEKIATQKASQAALQNSVNFTRAGKAMRVINLLLPYSNAGIQGSRNVARSFRKRPVATTMKSVAFVAVPTVLLTLMNYDDEETAKVYKNIDDTEKDDNFIIVLKGAKQNEAGSYEGIIKIPKPQGYRELTNPLRIAAERFAGNEKSGDVSKMVRDAMSAFTGPVSIEDSGKFISSLIPQAVKPTLQAIENKDYYWDSQTVPDYMIDGTDDPTKRAYKSTSGTARIIADQLGVSPILVEKFIQDTAGSVGRYGINLTDRGLNKLGIVKDDQIGGKTITGDFKRRTTEARAIEKTNKTDGQRYYDNVEKATGELPKYLQDSWKSYNTSDKNFLGEVLFEKNGQAKKQAKAAAYIEHPELFEVDKKLDKLNRKKGETGNPLYDLSYNQALIVVQEKALPPGAKDEGLNALYDQQWYSQYKNKEEKYYDKIFGKGGIEENKDNPYPERSPDLISAMDSYYDLPSSYAKGAWKKANPGIASQMEAYYSAKDAWTNTERAKLGLPPIEDRYAKYESSSGKSGSSGGSRGRSRRGSSGGSSGSRKGKFDYKFGAFAPGEIGSKKSLRKILEEAQL